MQNFNSAELRPVELARAYLQKKMLKKPLREDAGADVLWDSPCTAHVSRKLCIPPARITHRCRSLPDEKIPGHTPAEGKCIVQGTVGAPLNTGPETMYS